MVVISAAASAAVIKTGCFFLEAGFVALVCFGVDGACGWVGFRSRSSLFASIFKFFVGALLFVYVFFLLVLTFG